VKNKVELINFVLEYDGTVCPLFILLKLYTIHRLHRGGDNMPDRIGYLVISCGHNNL
jgi:hypothetical protein